MMKLTMFEQNGKAIVRVVHEEILITDVQSALDLMATVRYETGADRMILDKAAICGEFFDLKTKLAGEILQKFTNYHVKLAIVGDFSVYTSKSLRDFIYESNHGKDVFFLSTEEEAVAKLAGV
jgi:hypothetical protein